jgi:hypothetical protein
MPSVSFFSHPLVIPAFLAGILLSAAVVAWIRSLRHRGRLCPRCSSTTVPLISGFPLRLLGPSLVRRWCTGCGWKGLASRPAHERAGKGGKIRLNGSFRWGSPHPPPNEFFSWSESENGTREGTPLPRKDDLEGPELPLPSFQWREEPRISEGAGFNWAQDDAPPAIPFQFAGEEEEAESPSLEDMPPPPIPFRFAESSTSPAVRDEEVNPPPRRVLPNLGFRWRG